MKVRSFLLASLLTAPLAASAQAKTETFDTQASASTDGWTDFLDQANGENYGWSDTSHAAGTPGEAGGFWSVLVAFEAGTRIPQIGGLSLNDYISASGVLIITLPSTDATFNIGYFNANDPAGNAEILGITLADGNYPQSRIQAVVSLANSSSLTYQLVGPVQLSVGQTNFWSFVYDPTAGANSEGRLTLTYTANGSEWIAYVDLTAADRIAGATFNAFGIFVRGAGSTDTNTPMGIFMDNVTYTKGSASSCIFEIASTAAMMLDQNNAYVYITIPSDVTSGGPVSVDLVSTNPAVAYPDGASGGTLTVTFPQDSPYTMTNVPITAAAVGSTLFYLANATAGACISDTAGSSVLNVVSNTHSSPFPPLPVIPSGIFNITNYGAIGDGVMDNMTNIQNAINAASAAGGGTVEVPAGTFLSGPITLYSSINLQVDTNAMLQMLPFGRYPGGATNAKTFIGCNQVHDLEISGWGKIDGQGAAWWAYYGTNSSLVRPMMLDLYSCDRLFIHDITFQNPPLHHCGVRENGGNITISNLTVNTPSPSPNTDGLNFVGTNSVIEDCHISDGDDNIAMGATGPINGLLITNCTFGAGHGVSIGSGISVGVSNLTVINCTFNGTQNGIRMKCPMGDSAPVNNLNYFNLAMTNVNDPIVIYTYYNETGNPHKVTPAQVLAASNTLPVTTTTPVWRDITISNLTVSSPTNDIGGIVWGPTEMPISNLTLIRVTNTAPETFDLYNVRGVKIIDSQFNFASGNTFTLCNADVTISNTVPAKVAVTIGGASSFNTLALYNAAASMSSTDLFGANPLTLGGSTLANSGNLTLPAWTVLNFAVGTNGSLLVETGNLTLNSTVNVSDGGGFRPGAYALVSYSSSLGGNPTLGNTPRGYQCSLDTNTPGLVRLAASALPPMIENIRLNAGGGVTLTGGGGPENYSYYVLGSTNVTLPLSEWTRLATNTFDPLGNFSVSNLSQFNPQTFYWLRLP